MDEEGLTQLEMWAVMLNEAYEAFIFAGFSDENAIRLVSQMVRKSESSDND